MPVDDQIVYVRRRNIIVVVEEGEEEVECDHVNADLGEIEQSKEKKETDQNVSINKFCDMEDEKILAAKTFNLKHSAGEVVWDIQSDGEYLEWETMKSKEDTDRYMEIGYRTQ